MTEKFRKLMGIKDSSEKTEAVAPKDGDKDSNHADAINSKQATLFKNLDEQYSIARMSTHTHRGVGLGFANHRLAWSTNFILVACILSLNLNVVFKLVISFFFVCLH